MRALAHLDEAFLRWQFGVSRAKQLDCLDGILRLMSDGIPFSQACEYTRDVGSPVDRAVADRMLRGLDEGGTAVDAMASLFSMDVVGAMGAAAQSGDLAETGMPVLERLRAQHSARRGVVGQLLKPTLYVLFVLGMYGFCATQVWPRFEEVAAKERWPPLSQVVYEIGTAIVDSWLPALVVLPGLAIALRLLLRRYAGPGRRLLDRIWPFTLYRGLLAANALDELGTLLTAGREPAAALDTISAHASPYGRMYLEQMKRRLDEGRNLAEVLDVGFIANRDVVRLKLLAGYHNLRQTMALTGAAARDSTLRRLRNTAQVLDAAGIALAGTAVGVMFIAFYLTATLVASDIAG